MTFTGFAIGDGVAWSWADYETYLDDLPTGRDFSKVGIAGDTLVITGTGSAAVAREVAETAGELKSGAPLENLALLARVAREVAARRKAYDARFGDTCRPTTFGATLCENGRLRGFRLAEAEGFAPRGVNSWSSPHVDHAPRSAAEVEKSARAQLDIVRRQIPGATGRALTIVKLGPRGVASATVRL